MANGRTAAGVEEGEGGTGEDGVECGMRGVGCCVGGGESGWARSGRAAVRGRCGAWDVACGAEDKRSRRCWRWDVDVFMRWRRASLTWTHDSNDLEIQMPCD